jgi:hypothetical protein
MQANFSFTQTTKVYNSKLFFFVGSWYIGFLMILIKPKTLGVDFYAIEMGTIFFKNWGLLPLLWLWFYTIEVNITFCSF